MSKFTIPDIKNIIQISKQDFDAVTRLVNSMPDNLVDLKQWQLNVRTKLYDVGIMTRLRSTEKESTCNC